MPTLNWIGKDAVVKHHTQVPFRLLEPVPTLSLPSTSGRSNDDCRHREAGAEGGNQSNKSPPLLAGEGQGGGQDTGNLIVQGDNLLPLKALLPRIVKPGIGRLSELHPFKPEPTVWNFRIVRSVSEPAPVEQHVEEPPVPPGPHCAGSGVDCVGMVQGDR
ncbi:MAG: hypothetical protein R3F22_12415 [Lysobacteraceae bacterium]